MTDVLTKEQRARNMAAIRSRDTKPELLVRRFLHKRGLRYRLSYPLTGKPDLVFVSRRIAVFVHGCFWHPHSCRYSTTPETNRDFWIAKLDANRKRDSQVRTLLEKDGWKVLVVRECKLKSNREETLNNLFKRIQKG